MKIKTISDDISCSPVGTSAFGSIPFELIKMIRRISSTMTKNKRINQELTEFLHKAFFDLPSHVSPELAENLLHIRAIKFEADRRKRQRLYNLLDVGLKCGRISNEEYMTSLGLIAKGDRLIYGKTGLTQRDRDEIDRKRLLIWKNPDYKLGESRRNARSYESTKSWRDLENECRRQDRNIIDNTIKSKKQFLGDNGELIDVEWDETIQGVRGAIAMRETHAVISSAAAAIMTLVSDKARRCGIIIDYIRLLAHKGFLGKNPDRVTKALCLWLRNHTQLAIAKELSITTSAVNQLIKRYKCLLSDPPNDPELRYLHYKMTQILENYLPVVVPTPLMSDFYIKSPIATEENLFDE